MLCPSAHEASGGLGALTPLSSEEQRFLRMSAMRINFQWVDVLTPWFLQHCFCRIKRWWRPGPTDYFKLPKVSKDVILSYTPTVTTALPGPLLYSCIHGIHWLHPQHNDDLLVSLPSFTEGLPMLQLYLFSDSACYWFTTVCKRNNLLLPSDLYLGVLTLHKMLDFDWIGWMDFGLHSFENHSWSMPHVDKLWHNT